jgi:Myo-inositol-1-phosphate synthase
LANKPNTTIAPVDGKLGILIPGMGAVTSISGGWDIHEDNGYEAVVRVQVLDRSTLEQLKEPLSAINPMKAVFDREYVKCIHGPNVKKLLLCSWDSNEYYDWQHSGV